MAVVKEKSIDIDSTIRRNKNNNKQQMIGIRQSISIDDIKKKQEMIKDMMCKSKSELEGNYNNINKNNSEDKEEEIRLLKREIERLNNEMSVMKYEEEQRQERLKMEMLNSGVINKKTVSINEIPTPNIDKIELIAGTVNITANEIKTLKTELEEENKDKMDKDIGKIANEEWASFDIKPEEVDKKEVKNEEDNIENEKDIDKKFMDKIKTFRETTTKIETVDVGVNKKDEQDNIKDEEEKISRFMNLIKESEELSNIDKKEEEVKSIKEEFSINNKKNNFKVLKGIEKLKEKINNVETNKIVKHETSEKISEDTNESQVKVDKVESKNEVQKSTKEVEIRNIAINDDSDLSEVLNQAKEDKRERENMTKGDSALDNKIKEVELNLNEVILKSNKKQNIRKEEKPVNKINFEDYVNDTLEATVKKVEEGKQDMEVAMKEIKTKVEKVEKEEESSEKNPRIFSREIPLEETGLW